MGIDPKSSFLTSVVVRAAVLQMWGRYLTTANPKPEEGV